MLPKNIIPPHVHVYYQSHTAPFEIESGEVLKGKLPKKQTRMVQAWTEIHREELLADWALCQNQEQPFKIEPLR